MSLLEALQGIELAGPGDAARLCKPVFEGSKSTWAAECRAGLEREYEPCDKQRSRFVTCSRWSSRPLVCKKRAQVAVISNTDRHQSVNSPLTGAGNGSYFDMKVFGMRKAAKAVAGVSTILAPTSTVLVLRSNMLVCTNAQLAVSTEHLASEPSTTVLATDGVQAVDERLPPHMV